LRIAHGHDGAGDRELVVPCHRAEGLPRGELLRVEAVELRRDLRAQRRGVEPLDRADGAASGEQCLPGLVGADS
jgi:hypothetical protein